MAVSLSISEFESTTMRQALSITMLCIPFSSVSRRGLRGFSPGIPARLKAASALISALEGTSEPFRVFRLVRDIEEPDAIEYKASLNPRRIFICVASSVFVLSMIPRSGRAYRWRSSGLSNVPVI